MTTNSSSSHDPVEVTLRFSDTDAESKKYPLTKDDHARNLSQALQAAVDKAIDEAHWGPGPHLAEVSFAVEFTKRNPGDIGGYRIILTD